ATVRADAVVVDDLLLAVARQSVQNKLDQAKSSDVSGFGLSAPAAELDLTMPQREIHLRYGKKTVGGGDRIYIDDGPGTPVWVVDVAAGDLKKYGLDVPRAEVRLFARRGGDPVVLLVGSEENGACYLMEKGVPNVATATAEFAKVVVDAMDAPLAFRDRSFT